MTSTTPRAALATSADAGRPALRVVGLRKRYGDVVAVDGLDLTVAAGECFGLLGPNGAGKTTTIEICEGLTASDEGTVEETVRLFRSFYPRGRSVDEVIDLVQLGEKRSARVGKLSGGQKQRLALACAMVGDPELIFLDEPTTGLDPQSRRQLWGVLERFRAGGGTILITTHYMDEAERLCDRVAIVDHGRVIALGTPRTLIASLGAEHVVEFTSPGSEEVLSAEELQSLDGVQSARLHGEEWSLEVTELARAVPALLRELARRGLPLDELVTHSATLEDVFVSLTGRQLRDG
jgi:ABC-2 type transport system ATP-binding protein